MKSPRRAGFSRKTATITKVEVAIAARRLPEGFRVLTATPHTLEPSLRLAWNRLCLAHTAYMRPFLTADFATVVSRLRPRVNVCVFFQGDEPVAFFPYQFASARHAAIGWAEPLGGGMSDYCGVVAGPGLTFSPAGLLRAAGLTYFYFGQLDESQQALGLPGHVPVKGLLIRFPQGPEEYWREIKARDNKFVRDTMRVTRQLETTLGPLRLCSEAADATGQLEQLIQVKREQYKRTNADDALAEPWTRDLLFSLLRERLEHCRPSFTTLYAGDTWAASHFGIGCGDCLHYWFPVYNPELHRYSPGRLLLKALIDEGPLLGFQCIDCGLGEAQSKADFGNQEHTLYRGVWMRGGLRSFLARGIQSLQWRLAARAHAR